LQRQLSPGVGNTALKINLAFITASHLWPLVIPRTLRTTRLPRRIAAEALFANLLALFLLALITAGCGMEPSQAERPDWSLNGPDRPAQ
jgi:hypothetical protein